MLITLGLIILCATATLPLYLQVALDLLSSLDMLR